MKYLKNSDVFNNGEEISSWLIDENEEGELESNAGQEFLFLYSKEVYILKTDLDDNLRNPNKKAVPLKKEDIEDSFILEELKKSNEEFIL
ncbi:MAG: hypothetical protein M0R17_05600 [Candidatus Omnitrophica bacterium]|jgi:hypothetical protein|nr:hypothetical protein [Candidatus Omnitrophota bacterium]